MTSGLEGCVALVTGAGDESGLGFAHARLLADRGARIVLNDRGTGTLGRPEQGIQPGVAEQAARRLRALGAEAAANDGDVADPATAAAMVGLAIELWGRIDIVVNNAGVASAQTWPDVDRDELDRHVGVTLLGSINTAKAAWPHLIASGRGRVVNTGSAACLGSHVVAYASTKASLYGLTRAQALVGRPHGITANLVLPAAFTRLTNQLPESGFKRQLRDRFPPDAVARFVAHLVSEPCPVTGETFVVGGDRFARIGFAASPPERIGEEVDMADALGRSLAATDLTFVGDMVESMELLGMPSRFLRSRSD